MSSTFEDYKPYTKEEVCTFLDYLFLRYLWRGFLTDALKVQDFYKDFSLSPLSERVLEILGELKKKGNKTNDKS